MPLFLECPELDRWQTLYGEQMPQDQRERFERHLESCPVCQDRIDRTEEFGETLRKVGRQLGDPTVAPADPTLVQVLARLHEVKGPDRAAAEPADLYFLRPAEQPGLLGMLGDYQVQEVIGQGGMGVVLKAYEPALHRLVAIKVMATAVAGSATARRRFAREAQAAAAVCHDHVVTVHSVNDVDGLPYLVMQYVAGESLQERLDRTGPLELTEAVRIAYQTAAGLAAAHAQGLIHRDIKPANLLLENGLARVKISDFGLARMVDDVGLTQNGVVAGTPEYMAPEQARGEPVDHRSDLFSLGSVLYAMCTGVPPFRGPSTVAVLRQVSDQTPTPVRALNPDVPAWLETLITRLLAKAPADRIQSAAEVAALLEGYLAHLRQPAMIPPPSLHEERCTKGAERAAFVVPASSWRLPRWLVLLVLLLATLGLWNTFLAGDAPQSEQTLPKEFYHDFRGGKPIHPDMKWSGTDGEEIVEPEERGLHIKLPATRKRKDPFGLALASAVQGNFEITVGYEIVEANEPRTGTGVGFELYLMTETPDREAVGLTRTKRVDGSEQYGCHRMTGPTGKRRYLNSSFPAAEQSGRLRMIRTGTEVTLLVADGNAEEFRELCRYELGAENLQLTRFCAYPGQSSEPVDVRIVDIKIRSDILLVESVNDAATGSGGQAAISRGWLAAAEIIGLLVTLTLMSLGAWYYVRRSRRAVPVPVPAANPDTPAPPQEAAPVVSFACPGCRKAIKARAELAGKKGKCPQCGKALLVPGAKAGEIDSAAVEDRFKA